MTNIFIIYAKIFIIMIKNLSKTIKEQRKKLGWSQTKLAEMSQLDRTTIGALERNDFKDLGIRKVERVLSILGMTLNCEPVGLPTLDDLKSDQRMSK
jgi:transcriptional regulator with XRE-family HTH domain